MPNHPKSVFYTIGAPNTVPLVLGGEPNRFMAVVVENSGSVDYDVWVDPDELVSGPGAQPKPLVHGDKKKVKGGDIDVLKLKVKPKGYFPSGAHNYKYTIRWSDGTTEYELDPDIEIDVVHPQK